MAKIHKKSQLKIQETAFMLLALAFLFALLFIFYANYQAKDIQFKKNKHLEEQAISLLEKFSAMPEFSAIHEFSCSYSNCIDEDKLIALKNMTLYNDLWGGISRIQVREIYPEQRVIQIYQKGKADVTYSSFIPLCRTMQIEGYIWQQCRLAKLLVSIEKVELTRK